MMMMEPPTKEQGNFSCLTLGEAELSAVVGHHLSECNPGDIDTQLLNPSAPNRPDHNAKEASSDVRWARRRSSIMSNASSGLGEKSSAGRVIVEVHSPHKMMDCREHWLDLFGFTRKECLGKSIRILQGPQTNMDKLSELVQGATLAKQEAVHLVLYNKGGEEMTVSVVAEPVQGSQGNMAVALDMKDLSALPSGECYDMLDETARVVISFEEPFQVCEASTGFISLFGVTRAQLQAQGISLIFTNQEEKKKWLNLVDMVRESGGRTHLLSTISGEEKEMLVLARLTPVSDATGAQSMVAVAFCPLRPADDLDREIFSPVLPSSPRSTKAMQILRESRGKGSGAGAEGVSPAAAAHIKALKALRALH